MSHNLAVCPVCGGAETEREECVNCGIPLSRFVERPKRGGLRNPSGGRPKKPPKQKYQKRLISLPPEIAKKLDEVENASDLVTQLLTWYFEKGTHK